MANKNKKLHESMNSIQALNSEWPTRTRNELLSDSTFFQALKLIDLIEHHFI